MTPARPSSGAVLTRIAPTNGAANGGLSQADIREWLLSSGFAHMVGGFPEA